jgi:hypothetical protein
MQNPVQMKQSYIKHHVVRLNTRILLLVLLVPFAYVRALAAPPTITSQPSNSTVCEGSNASFTVSATGATAYQWQILQGATFVNLSNGGVYSGVNTATLTITGATASLNGNSYRVVVTGTPQTRNSNSATLTVIQPPSISSHPQNTMACEGGTAAFNVTASGGGLSYQWQENQGSGFTNISNGGVYSGANTATLTLSNVTAAMNGYAYRVIVSGTCSPAATSNPAALTVITINTSGTQTNVSCNDGNDGSATVTASGGTRPYSYSWAPSGGNDSTATALAAGSYTVTVTDISGCTATRTFTITEPPALTASSSQTDASCSGSCDGSATVTPSGGTPGYTYAWAPSGGTDSTASGLCAGTYTVTVTDMNGCIITHTLTITEPPLLQVSSTVTHNLCAGDSAGAIDITVSGGVPPYSFSWSTGATTEDESGLPAGIYIIVVTDSSSCTVIDTAMVNDPPALALSAAVTHAGCHGDSTGAIDITVTGGAGPYTFSWSTGSADEDQGGLAAGVYIVAVTDSNGCMLTDTIIITAPAALMLSASVTHVSCHGDSTGAIDVTVSGGVIPYEFSWNSGDTIEDINGVPAGTYIIAVVDSNGCMTIETITVLQPDPLSLSASVTSVFCHGDSTGAIDITVSGGSPPYTFGWSSGETTEDISGLPAGSFIVTVTDSSGCMISDTITVTEPGTLIISASVTNASCHGDSTGAIDISVSGGSSPYTFSWSSGAVTEDINGLPAGDYIVTVTDSNNCMIADTFTVTQPSGISISASITHVACSGDSTGAIDITVSGGVPPYTFVWSNGETTEDISGLPAGDYIVTITDSNSCMIADTITVTQPSGINISASITHVNCSGDSTGVIDITVSGGTAPYTFTWSNSTTIEDLANIPAGMYVISITDSNSCTAIDTFIIIPIDSSLIGIIAPDTVCLRSAPILLTANPPGGIFSGGGVNGNIFDPTVSDQGVFVITYTYEGTGICHSGPLVLTDTIWVVVCSSVDEVDIGASITLAPNPASGQFSISVSGVKEKDVLIRLVGVDGKLVLEERKAVSSGSISTIIDVPGLSKGLYFVQVVAGDKVYNERIIIQ